MTGDYGRLLRDKTPDECRANLACPNPRLPGSDYCAYHEAVIRAAEGDKEAITLCREKWGLVHVR